MFQYILRNNQAFSNLSILYRTLRVTLLSSYMQTSFGQAEYKVLTAVLMESSHLYLLHAGFLPGLIFGPEDGGTMFFRNIS
jgi:hypothetical protein